MNFALLDPLIQPHNLSHSDNLWWKGDTLVVIGDNNLKKGVLHFYHDTPVVTTFPFSLPQLVTRPTPVP